jgi:hypothetical protein
VKTIRIQLAVGLSYLAVWVGRFANTLGRASCRVAPDGDAIPECHALFADDED